MLTKATQTSTTSTAPQDRRELTFDDVAKVLRRDAETGQLYWIVSRRGRVKAGMRAGCELRRKGKAVGRVITFNGQRLREWHVSYLLQHETWPSEKRMRKTPEITSASVVTTTPEIATPIVPVIASPATPTVPHDLSEISRAGNAAAAPSHPRWLFGLGRRAA